MGRKCRLTFEFMEVRRGRRTAEECGEKIGKYKRLPFFFICRLSTSRTVPRCFATHVFAVTFVSLPNPCEAFINKRANKAEVNSAISLFIALYSRAQETSELILLTVLLVEEDFELVRDVVFERVVDLLDRVRVRQLAVHEPHPT